VRPGFEPAFFIAAFFRNLCPGALVASRRGQIEKEKGKGNDHPIETDIRACYGALALGLIHSSPTPVKETPLSKSDIVIAQDTSGQDSAKMGESSGTKTSSDGRASEGKTGLEKMSQQPSKSGRFGDYD
jgi:hypothetical protein